MNFDTFIARWNLTPDGEPIATPTSELLPVLFRGEPAMLKVATVAEERWGAGLMEWWDGDGAARVLARDGDAILLERASGHRSLADMAKVGKDDEATRIICAVAARLHARRDKPPLELTPLTEWFRVLAPAAARHGGLIRRAADTAQELLADPREITVLHGDLHHGNVLDAGMHGWLAIDPKRLSGERAFDFVNILRNPDAGHALAPGRLLRQADVIAKAANLDRDRLLKWVVAFTGLSAVWILGDGVAPALDLAVAEIAARELGQV